MSRDETITLIKILATAYPDFYNYTDKDKAENTVNLWYEYFKNEPKEIVYGAVKKYIGSSNKAPHIADIREEMYNITNYEDDLESFESVIGEIREAMHNSSYHAQEEFNKLSPIAQKIVHSPSTLREWAISTNFNEQVWRGQMARQFESAKRRAKEEKMMLPGVRKLIENMNIKKLEE